MPVGLKRSSMSLNTVALFSLSECAINLTFPLKPANLFNDGGFHSSNFSETDEDDL